MEESVAESRFEYVQIITDRAQNLKDLEHQK